VEVIVALIMISLFGIVLVSFYDTQVKGSTKSVTMMQQGFALEEILEKINADYKDLLISDPTPLVTLNNKINTVPSVYGEYTAVNKFISFDNTGAETGAPCTVDCTALKVSVTIEDQTITTLFTR